MMSDATKIRVGYGRTDITPEMPINMGGYGNPDKRISNNVLDPLKATCVAITDAQDNTLLLFCTDAIGVQSMFTDEVRKIIQERFGIAPNHVMVSATHSHSTPDLGASVKLDHPHAPKYINGLVNAAEQALADREEAEIYIGRGEANGLNFVRHYAQINGEYYGSNFGSSKLAPTKGHAEPADPEFQLIKFARENGQDILMMNWQAHPCSTGGIQKYNVSADYIGTLRRYIEDNTGMHFIYFQGACGNQTTSSQIKGEHIEQDRDIIGIALAKKVLPALEKLYQVNGGLIKVAELEFEYPVNHTEDHLVPAAQEVQKVWEETRDRPRCNAMAVERGMRSVYHAGAVIRKSKMGEMSSLPIKAVCVGDIAFACAPYEMFGANGVEIKTQSPFAKTFVLGYTNGSHGYLPTRKAFEYRCYEANTTRFAPGIGEGLSGAFVNLLKGLKD